MYMQGSQDGPFSHIIRGRTLDGNVRDYSTIDSPCIPIDLPRKTLVRPPIHDSEKFCQRIERHARTYSRHTLQEKAKRSTLWVKLMLDILSNQNMQEEICVNIYVALLDIEDIITDVAELAVLL
ncbi:hypothetical protein CC78DRAFT_588201 [Lojkania enalia]|uniref:Uncharacterized protein n=1 Tax=Lojkania enalia TaxID=147567 RepID=A0A9P4JWE8_9PLEO|nr:hypothetical protein CC78DRAFT_588201 [Didymosphaeria enalia]